MKYYADAPTVRKLAGKVIKALGKSVFEREGRIYFYYDNVIKGRRTKIHLAVDSKGKVWVAKEYSEYSFLELLGAKVCGMTGVRTPQLKLAKVDGERKLLSELVGNPLAYAKEKLAGEEAASVIVPRLVMMCSRPDKIRINPEYLDIDLNEGNHLLGFDGKIYEIDFVSASVAPAEEVLHFLRIRRARLDCRTVATQIELMEKCNKFLLLRGVPEPFKTKIKVNIKSLRMIVAYLITKGS